MVPFRTFRWRSPGALQECLGEESPGVMVTLLARTASRWGLTDGSSGRVSTVSSGREATVRSAIDSLRHPRNHDREAPVQTLAGQVWNSRGAMLPRWRLAV